MWRPVWLVGARDPIALVLDGRAESGKAVIDNPVTDGPGTWVRIGPRTAPYLLFLPAQ